jgi:hypothetical protein
MDKPMKTLVRMAMLLAVTGALASTQASDAQIEVKAGQTLHPISRYLTGACIEDVNHEIYGGIYSQMVFGESFQEPAPPLPFKEFTAYGGRWTLRDAGIEAEGGDGFKLVAREPMLSAGEVVVELLFPEKKGGNAGLILNVGDPGIGADRFIGYEIALDVSGRLILGRHRQNFEPIREVPCEVPINQWITLGVRTTNSVFEVLLNGKTITQYEDTLHPLAAGRVGLRTWRQDVWFRNLQINTADKRQALAFDVADGASPGGVSGMWRAVRSGTANGAYLLETNAAFAGNQSQRLTFVGGEGEIGVENQSLNRWGMNFVKSKPYEGHVWARADKPVELFVALENRDGTIVYAEKRLPVAKPKGTNGTNWQRLDFTLTPSADDKSGRFAIKLKQPGSVLVGYAFLQPGEWGRFKKLPVRKDVVEGLINQGITVLRYGGSMVNHPEYKWKKMVGPRDRRPPNAGTWYPYSSNGWGILDFLNLCEAAGFLAIPDFNVNETPQDMADFIEYVHGSADTQLGRARVADGHPAPYKLKYIELGNEERVDESYWQKFKPLAEAIWAKDPDITIVVGDFAYGNRITDPFRFDGAASGITTLAAHKNILDLAKAHNREVWFDLHVGTEGPRPDSTLAATLSYIDAMARIADGARHKVLVFELNANNPTHRRALANAVAINAAERDGRLPIVTSANCLQPDGENDNGWNQGLLFLNPSKVWLQPPGYVTRMISRNYESCAVGCEVKSPDDSLDVSAKRSEDGKTLVLQVVNTSKDEMMTNIRIAGYAPTKTSAKVEQLAGSLDARNTAENPEQIQTTFKQWPHELKNGETTYHFPPYSFTVMRFE